MKHALVTGGAGFIGSHLVDHLLREHGCRVTVLDDLSTGRLENMRAPARLIEGDVRDATTLRDAAGRDVDVVFHLAALTSVPRSLEEPVAAADVNVGGTLQVLEAARACGARRVVFASSSSVYGDAGEAVRQETMPLDPCSPYAASKAAAEGFIHAYAEAFGLESAVLRFFNVYGPRQRADSPYAAAIPSFIAAALEGRAPVIEGDGEQTRDFTFVADVADAIARAADAPGAVDGPINIGAGSRTSIRAVVAQVAVACGAGAEPAFAAAREGDVRHAQADITRAREVLAWTPSTGLADGIARTVSAARAAPVQT